MLLQSRACIKMYQSLDHDEQHVFMWTAYITPHFSTEDEKDTETTTVPATPTTMNPQEEASPQLQNSIQLPKNTFKHDKLLNMRKAICIRLGQRPYSMVGFLMFFNQKPMYLPEVPPDDMYDKIEFAITCNENITDVELSHYILASQGRIMALLDKQQEQLASVGQYGQSEAQEYRDEIIYLVARIGEHPTMQQFKGNSQFSGLLIRKATSTMISN